jgi:hypothetical protein
MPKARKDFQRKMRRNCDQLHRVPPAGGNPTVSPLGLHGLFDVTVDPEVYGHLAFDKDINNLN